MVAPNFGEKYVSSQLIKRYYKLGDIVAERCMGKKPWYLKRHSFIQNTVRGYPLGHGPTAHMMIVTGFDSDNYPVVSHLSHPDFNQVGHYYKGSPLTLGLPITQRLPEVYARAAIMVIRPKSAEFAKQISDTAKLMVTESYAMKVKFTLLAVVIAGFNAQVRKKEEAVKKAIKQAGATPLKKFKIQKQMICTQFIASIMERTCFEYGLEKSEFFNVRPAVAIGRAIEDTVKNEHMDKFHILITTPGDDFSCHRIRGVVKALISSNPKINHFNEPVEHLFDFFEHKDRNADYDFNSARVVLCIIKNSLTPKAWLSIKNYLAEGTKANNFEDGFGMFCEDIDNILFSSVSELKSIEKRLVELKVSLEKMKNGKALEAGISHCERVICNAHINLSKLDKENRQITTLKGESEPLNFLDPKNKVANEKESKVSRLENFLQTLRDTLINA